MSKTSQPRGPALPARETDLYAPVRAFLVAQGFKVRAEVRGCDVAAEKGEHVVVVELKLGFTLDLLLQGVKRQRVADLVYLAVPRPAKAAHEARLRENLPLLRRLELGLLVVDFRNEPPVIDVALQPVPFERRRDGKGRKALLRELALRSGDDNTGGSTRRSLVTAYRENALLIAAALVRFGPLAPRQLRAVGTGAKTLSILHGNVYGWFERLDRALYRVKPAGETALQTYAAVVARIGAQLPAQLPD
ncbi:MAG: hypothetical protein IPL39_00965 [Opitutaceae bacterium]|nr:hypothetical protein [Opitutaceae bacterium]